MWFPFVGNIPTGLIQSALLKARGGAERPLPAVPSLRASAVSSIMSLSPATPTSYNEPNGHKRRRTGEFEAAQFPNAQGGMGAVEGGVTQQMGPAQGPPPPTAHIPKRGARACTNCRKGKNRCEGEVSRLCLPSRACKGPLGAASPPSSRQLTSTWSANPPGPAFVVGSVSSMSAQWYTVHL